jgi:hypothetical protein
VPQAAARRFGDQLTNPAGQGGGRQGYDSHFYKVSYRQRPGRSGEKSHHIDR